MYLYSVRGKNPLTKLSVGFNDAKVGYGVLEF